MCVCEAIGAPSMLRFIRRAGVLDEDVTLGAFNLFVYYESMKRAKAEDKTYKD